MSYHNSSSPSSYSAPATSQRQAAPPGYHYMPNGTLMLDADMQSSTPAREANVAPPGYHFMPDGSLMLDAAMGSPVAPTIPLPTAEAPLQRMTQPPPAWFARTAENPAGLPAKPIEVASIEPGKVIKSFDFDVSSMGLAGELRTGIISGTPGIGFYLEVLNASGLYYNFLSKAFQATAYRFSSTDEETTGQYRFSVLFPLSGSATTYTVRLFARHGTKHDTYREVRLSDGSVDVNGSIGSNSLLISKTIDQKTNKSISLGVLSINSLTPFSGTAGVAQAFSTGEKEIGATIFSIPVTAGNTHSIRGLQPPTEDDLAIFVQRVIGTDPLEIPGENVYPTVTATGKINVAVSDSTTVTIDGLSATPLVGDKFVITDGPNSTSPQVVTAVGEGNITSSVAISADNDKNISFSNQMNYRWPIDNITGLTPGVDVIGDNVTADSIISKYRAPITYNADTSDEVVVQKEQPKSIELAPVKAVITKNTSTKSLKVVQQGYITFSEQQKLALGGDTVKVIFRGVDKIKKVTGWDLSLSDLTLAVTKPTSIITAAVNSSTSVVVANADGIMDDVSTVSGLGIDSKAIDPTVTNIASYTGTTATLTLSAAQTLKDGTLLTFGGGAGKVITIGGELTVNSVGASFGANEDITDWDGAVFFDIERFLVATDES